MSLLANVAPEVLYHRRAVRAAGPSLGARMEMNEQVIEAFWEEHPCGDRFVPKRSEDSYDQFFTEYDRFRYSSESHIPRCLDQLDLPGKRVLEIGIGQGADSEQMIRRGARWTGIDLTQESVDRVRTRLELRELPYDRIVRGSVLELPFGQGEFDFVFSHGVLHHVPEIRQAQAEIARVLRPAGEAVIMVYAKYSLNYLVSIALVRRLGLIAIYGLSALGFRATGIYAQHIDNARRSGLHEYLRLGTFVHSNTDGPSNPYSRVYGLSDVRRAFASFRVTRAHKEFMHAPPLPVHSLPGARACGWHLWVHLRPAAPCPDESG